MNILRRIVDRAARLVGYITLGYIAGQLARELGARWVADGWSFDGDNEPEPEPAAVTFRARPGGLDIRAAMTAAEELAVARAAEPADAVDVPMVPLTVAAVE